MSARFKASFALTLLALSFASHSVVTIQAAAGAYLIPAGIHTIVSEKADSTKNRTIHKVVDKLSVGGAPTTLTAGFC